MHLPLTLLALLTPSEPLSLGTERAVAERRVEVSRPADARPVAAAEEPPKKPQPQPKPKPQPRPEPRPDPCPACGMG